ncbi:MAG: winged helix-turn-helix domain-containing protein [Lysobacter sp.]|nr:winged helix-turn-helix domain-containing protein [Lysobacter sp.]
MTSTARTTAWPWPEHATRLVVGDLRIDLPNRRVERPDGVRQELPQRVFDLLLVFLADPGTVHSRDALFERVWQGVIVEDANLTQGVWMLRKAFGEERRQWFRTVSKTGYVFEPPTPVRTEDEDGAAVPHDEASAQVDAARSTVADTTADAGSAPRRPRATRTAIASSAITTVATILLAAVALLLPVIPRDAMRGTSSPATAAEAARRATAPLRIHLAAEPPLIDARTPDGLWTALLADAWLGYKLELLPETLLMPPGQATRARLDPDERRISVRASLDPKRPDAIVLQARITGLPGEDLRMIEVRGRATQATALAEDLSQQVLARLLPAHDHSAWPALPRDLRAARGFALGTQAARRRDWASAEREADAAAGIAPTFGPLRWLQARLLARRGDIPTAIERATEAQRASTPLPDEAGRVFEAQVLLLDPARRNDAIARYTALMREWPGRIDYAVARAQLLTRTGQPAEALASVSHPESALRALPVDLRIRREIAAAEATMLNGDPAASRWHAQAALTLVAAAGSGFDRERGAARMMVARAHQATPGSTAAPGLYELAADAFEAGGDAPNALYARFIADNIRLDAKPEAQPSTQLEPLIASARRMRNVALEVEALRITAYRFYRAGEHGRFRDYLRQAQDAVNRSDDLNSQRLLDLDLMGEDFFMANFSSARARIRRLRTGGMDGAIGYLVPLLDGTMTFHEGRHREALSLLRDGDTPGKQKPPTVVEANYACVRADILLAMLDTVAARPQIDRCRNLGHPSLRAAARLLDVQADLADGDSDGARIKLRGIEQDITTLSSGVERWALAGGIGYAIAAVGDYERAERLLAREIDATRDAGYLLMLAGIETSLAEVAAARGDWPRSRALGLSARGRLPRDAWLLNLRLDRLDIIDARIHGDLPAARARMASLRARAEALDDRVVLNDLRVLASIIGNDGRGPSTGDGSAPLDPSRIYIDWIYGRLPAQHAGTER